MYKINFFFWIFVCLGVLLMGFTGCTIVPIPTHDAKTPKKVSPQLPQKVGEDAPSPHYSARIPPSPIPAIRHYVARGFITWYGIADHGAKTASGQVYDLYGMTAAHATLPLNTRVNVKNLKTNRSIVVTVNDRLYDERKLIKLSYWGANRLGLVKRPSQEVEVRVIR
jgi:rare lipoprotein A